MNDSEYESDKEDKCIPRFKNKREWNPPRSKNDNLESFISYQNCSKIIRQWQTYTESLRARKQGH